MYRPSFFDDHPVAVLVLVIVGVIALLTVRSCHHEWIKELLMK
jgi:hypothetical protein